MPVKPETRMELKEALRFAVDGENRFGNRDDTRSALDERWDRVIELLMKLCQQTPRSK